jgi:hypothetical protein
MKKLFITTAILGFVITPNTALASEVVFGGDGTFLGTVTTDRYDQDSICNRFGEYGSKFNESIFNTFGTHGGKFSELGSYNRNATHPPRVIDVQRRVLVAYITKNPRFQPRLDPDVIPSMVCEQ